MIKWRKFLVGSGKARAGFVGLLDQSNVSAAGVGSVATGALNLLTATLRANALYKNAMRIRIVAEGSFAANGNNKEIQIQIGGTVIFDTGVLTDNNVPWYLEAYLVRTGSKAQFSYGFIFGGTTLRAQTRTAGLVIDNTVDQVISVTALTAIANNDILANDLQVEALTL